jgi:hypothetical protein
MSWMIRRFSFHKISPRFLTSSFTTAMDHRKKIEFVLSGSKHQLSKLQSGKRTQISMSFKEINLWESFSLLKSEAT